MNRSRPSLAGIAVTLLLASLSAQGIVHEADEPNAAVGMETPIGAGSQAVGALTPGDVDAFVLTVARPARLTAWTGPGGAGSAHDTIVELATGTGVVVAANDDAPGREHHAAVQRLVLPGTWRVVVRGGNGDAGSYSLDVRVDFAPPLLVEEPEPNGDPTLGGRPTVAGVETMIEGAIQTPGDTDWVEIHLPTAQTLLALTSAPQTPSLPDPLLRLWFRTSATSPMLALAADDNSGGGHHARLAATLPAGRYWLEVRDVGNGTGHWLLQVESLAQVHADEGGCPGTGGWPRLDVPRDRSGRALELPMLGTTFAIDGSGVPADGAVLHLVGLPAPGNPWPLDPLALCNVVVAPIAADLVLADRTGRHRGAFPLPLGARGHGLQFAVQAVVLDPLANQIGLTVSNRLTARCGTGW